MAEVPHPLVRLSRCPMRFRGERRQVFRSERLRLQKGAVFSARVVAFFVLLAIGLAT